MGQDILLTLRQGALSLFQVLEIQEDMEQFYVKMVKAAPDSKVGMEGLIRIYAKRGAVDAALHWYDALLASYPEEYTTGLGLGAALLDLRKPAEAAKVFARAVAIKREYESLYQLGYALAVSGKKAESIGYLVEAAALDPTDERAFYSLGYVYRDTGRPEDAKQAWRKVLELVPNFPEVQRNLQLLER